MIFFYTHGFAKNVGGSSLQDVYDKKHCNILIKFIAIHV